MFKHLGHALDREAILASQTVKARRGIHAAGGHNPSSRVMELRNKDSWDYRATIREIR